MIKQRINIYAGIIILAVLFYFPGQSQTKKEAYNFLTRGVECHKNGDIQGAIKSFEQAIELCNKAGSEADNIKSEVLTNLCKLYYKAGIDYFKKQQLDSAIVYAEKAYNTSQECNNNEVSEKSKKFIPQLYKVKANNYLKDGKYSLAIENYKKALKYNPDYEVASYYMAMAYKKMDNEEEFLMQIEKTLELCKKNHNQKIEEKAREIVKNYFYNKAVKAQKSKSYKIAVNYIKKSIEYKEYAKAYHFLALLYNDQKKWSEALAAIDKAISLSDEKTAEEKAKYYYEQGRAYQGLGNKDKACTAYKQAAAGKYEKLANYKMKNELKCK